MFVTVSRRSSRIIHAAKKAGINIDLYDTRAKVAEQEQVDTF